MGVTNYESALYTSLFYSKSNLCVDGIVNTGLAILILISSLSVTLSTIFYYFRYGVIEATAFVVEVKIAPDRGDSPE